MDTLTGYGPGVIQLSYEKQKLYDKYTYYTVELEKQKKPTPPGANLQEIIDNIERQNPPLARKYELNKQNTQIDEYYTAPLKETPKQEENNIKTHEDTNKSNSELEKPQETNKPKRHRKHKLTEEEYNEYYNLRNKCKKLGINLEGYKPMIDRIHEMKQKIKDHLNGKPQPKKTEIRKEVMAVAILMEETLQENDHKTGWEDCSLFYLVNKMREEDREFEKELWELNREYDLYDQQIDIEDLHPITNQIEIQKLIDELIDSMNMRMMIIDNLTKKTK